MVEARIGRKVVDASHRASFRIRGPEDNPRDPSGQRGTGTHRTGFQRHDQVTIRQAPSTQFFGSRAQHQDLGMGRRVMIDFTTVMGARQHLVVFTHYPSYQCADWNVVVEQRKFSLCERKVHQR